MITFGNHHSVGTGSIIPTATGIYENDKEIGAIYFMPLSFNHGFGYQVILKKEDIGFFESLDCAKRHVLTGLPVAVEYY